MAAVRLILAFNALAEKQPQPRDLAEAVSEALTLGPVGLSLVLGAVLIRVAAWHTRRRRSRSPSPDSAGEDEPLA